MTNHNGRERGRGSLHEMKHSRFWYAVFTVRKKERAMSTKIPHLLHDTAATEKQKAEAYRKAIKVLDAELDKRSADMVNGTRQHHQKREQITFADFAQKWAADVLSQHKYSTTTTDSSRLRAQLVPFFGDYLLDELGPELVQRFISRNHQSSKSIKNCIALLRLMWGSAKAWGYVGESWETRFDEGIRLPEIIKQEAPCFTLEEMQQIISAETDPARQLFWWLCAEMGCRIGETCALRVRSFNFQTGKVVIRESAYQGHVGSVKTKRPRVVDLSPLLLAAVQQFTGTRSSDAFIFATASGGCWNGNDLVKRHLRPLLKRLGIQPGVKRLASHAFRHGNITVMDRPEMAVPLKVRSDRVGHVDSEAMTLGTYTHASSAEARAFAARLGELLMPQSTSIQ